MFNDPTLTLLIVIGFTLYSLIRIRIILKRKQKKITLIPTLVMLIILWVFWVYQYSNALKWRAYYSKVYQLTDYPNSDSAQLVLFEDGTYIIYENKISIDQGEWSLTQGLEDIDAIPLINDSHLLGQGRFEFNQVSNHSSIPFLTHKK